MLVSIAYYESWGFFKEVLNFFIKPVFQIRFVDLHPYDEASHTIYIQSQLENAIEYNSYKTISHGIYVEKNIAKVAFLEQL